MDYKDTSSGKADKDFKKFYKSRKHEMAKKMSHKDRVKTFGNIKNDFWTTPSFGKNSEYQRLSNKYHHKSK